MQFLNLHLFLLYIGVRWVLDFLSQDLKKQERCEPFQDDRELLWVWMRTGLDENGFGREWVWTRKGLDENGFGRERVWTRTGLDQNGFGPERVWTRTG